MIDLKFDDITATATILMRRPPVNAIDAAFVAAFNESLEEVERRQPTIVIIRSGQKCFSAGADLTLVSAHFGSADGIDRMVDYVKSLHSLFNRVERLAMVTLAVIEGPALGGGLELALACDLRVASAKATLGLPEARIGMIPGAGGTQRLTRLSGPGVSSRMILGGEVIDGTEAAGLGVVQWVENPDAVAARVTEIVNRISGLSRPALALSKSCIAAWSDPDIDGFALEIEAPRLTMKTTEARQRITAFLAGRK